jgi:hypothetical protein
VKTPALIIPCRALPGGLGFSSEQIKDNHAIMVGKGKTRLGGCIFLSS